MSTIYEALELLMPGTVPVRKRYSFREGDVLIPVRREILVPNTTRGPLTLEYKANLELYDFPGAFHAALHGGNPRVLMRIEEEVLEYLDGKRILAAMNHRELITIDWEGANENAEQLLEQDVCLDLKVCAFVNLYSP